MQVSDHRSERHRGPGDSAQCLYSDGFHAARSLQQNLSNSSSYDGLEPSVGFRKRDCLAEALHQGQGAEEPSTREEAAE